MINFRGLKINNICYLNESIDISVIVFHFEWCGRLQESIFMMSSTWYFLFTILVFFLPLMQVSPPPETERKNKHKIHAILTMFHNYISINIILIVWLYLIIEHAETDIIFIRKTRYTLYDIVAHSGYNCFSFRLYVTTLAEKKTTNTKKGSSTSASHR